METPDTLRQHLAALGRKGGQASGERKRRDPEHYRRLTEAREARRRERPWSTRPKSV